MQSTWKFPIFTLFNFSFKRFLFPFFRCNFFNYCTYKIIFLISCYICFTWAWFLIVKCLLWKRYWRYNIWRFTQNFILTFYLLRKVELRFITGRLYWGYLRIWWIFKCLVLSDNGWSVWVKLVLIAQFCNPRKLILLQF